MSLNIKQARESLHISQSELSRRMDLSRGVCHKWENGTALPPISQLPKLAKVLGVSIDFLLGDVDIQQDKNNIHLNHILNNIKKLNAKQIEGLSILLQYS